MANDLDKLQRQVGQLGQFFYGKRRVDWRDQHFTPEKAYVCAVLANVAYLELTDYELTHHKYVKLIPSLCYREVVARGINIDLRQFLSQAEFRDVFVIPTEHLIVVGMVQNDVIFIALRGTRFFALSDWLIDLHSRSVPTYVNGIPGAFHSGFYLHITQCIEQIADAVSKRQSSPPMPVYVVGHSLGGAMAAILHALDNTHFASYYRGGSEISVNINTTCSYTYGMPRYGNEPMVYQLRSPYCLINENDVVPTVPPKWLDYADAPDRWRLSDNGTLVPASHKIPWLLSAAKRLYLLRGLSRHRIENYVKFLAKTVGV